MLLSDLLPEPRDDLPDSLDAGVQLLQLGLQRPKLAATRNQARRGVWGTDDQRAVRPQEFPGQVLACEIYLQGGIRSCEIGSVLFGKMDPVSGTFLPATLELVRLAIPRRVYTQSHIDYVAECIGEVFQVRDQLGGMRIVSEPPVLRHFTARFEPIKS